MKDLAIKAEVTGAGGFYYREEHEWRGLAPEAGAEFEKFLDGAAHLAQGGGKHHDDPDNLRVVLSAVVDGNALPDLVVDGVSYAELLKFQRHALKFGDEVVGWAETRPKAQHKGK